MPYASKRQQRYFNFLANKKGGKWKKLANDFNNATYPSKGGSKTNKRKYARLPTKVHRKKKR